MKTKQFISSAFLKGSIANGKSDEYSDIDLYCVTEKKTIGELKSFRNHIINNFRDILYTENVNFGLDQIIVIFDNDLHLDFYITDSPPTEGYAPIFILYDKKGELQKYILKHPKNNIDGAIQYYNESVYTLHELLIALKRNDQLWSMRLISHMIAYLSLVLCYKYNSGNGILHMKNLYYTLPKKEKEQIDEILKFAIPSNIPKYESIGIKSNIQVLI